MHKNRIPSKEEMIDWVQAVLYLVGMTLIRRCRQYRRRARYVLRRINWRLRWLLDDIKQESELRRRLEPQSTRQRVFTDLVREYSNFKERRTGLRELLPYLRPAIICAGNYLLPLGGMIVLICTAAHYSSLEYALRLEMDGVYVGHIYQEQELLTAQKEIQERLIYHEQDAAFLQQPVYTFEAIQPDQHTPMQILANNLIRASGQEVVQAAGLYIDGHFLGAAQDGDRVLAQLSSRKEETRRRYPNARVEFVQHITLTEGLYPIGSVCSNEEIEAKLDAESRTEQSQEIAQSQEMWGSDAAPAKIALQQRAVETVVRWEEIPYPIEESIDKNEDITYQVVLQEGHNGVEEITTEITYIGDVKVAENEIYRSVLQPAVEKKIVRGSLVRTTGGDQLPENYQIKTASARNAGGFIWPVDGGSISCDINGYYGHTGNDIAAPKGTAIWASKAGTVVHSGWSGGYGYNVLIDHGDGYKTRYAHCSALLCDVGQQVEQGQQIALVGRTGYATCNHCHFEVIQNSQFLDARKFVGSR